MHHRASLILIITASILFVSSTAAQSGRRRSAQPTPTPSADSQTKNVDKPAPVELEAAQAPAISAAPTILVVGQVVHGYTYYSSGDLDAALKECVSALSLGRRSLKPIRGGKMDYTEAKERAKLNTEDRVLWISFVTHDDGMGNMFISYAEYALLGPGANHVLSKGRIDTNKSGILSRGGVIGLPTGHPRQSRHSIRPTMKSMAREVSAVLLRGGWFDR